MAPVGRPEGFRPTLPIKKTDAKKIETRAAAGFGRRFSDEKKVHDKGPLQGRHYRCALCRPDHGVRRARLRTVPDTARRGAHHSAPLLRGGRTGALCGMRYSQPPFGIRGIRHTFGKPRDPHSGAFDAPYGQIFKKQAAQGVFGRAFPRGRECLHGSRGLVSRGFRRGSLFFVGSFHACHAIRVGICPRDASFCRR